MRKDLDRSKAYKTFLNFNDIIVVAIFITIIAMLTKGWLDMHANFDTTHVAKISLNLSALPYYTLRSTMRLVIGLVLSFAFALIFGTLSAKFKAIERVVLPFVNFMESVPLVGFLTFTTLYFMSAFPHSIMGLECAAIFGVFTGQAWNMCLIVYQTLKVVPYELIEAADMFQYNAWQRFWRLEFPYSIPGLLWNTMVSQSAAWFALVATEAIPVHGNTVELPGIGSYIAESLLAGNATTTIYAIIALTLNIIIFDQLVFRPLVKYANQYKFEDLASKNGHTSWFHTCILNSGICNKIGAGFNYLSYLALFDIPKYTKKFNFPRVNLADGIKRKFTFVVTKLWYLLVITLIIIAGYNLWKYLPKAELHKMPILMLETTIRVSVAMILSILIFVPLGVWIGLQPKLVKAFQPIIQVLAALPCNIFYPLMALFLITTHQTLSVWSIFLIMLGTQWYVLFNVIAGASTIPNQLLEVNKCFGVRGLLWWRKFMIPAIFPYIVTGIISAAGGAWNAAIAGELLIWGTTTQQTSGLGAYISNASNAGQMANSALGCTSMCLLVGVCIMFVWKPLYKLAETRFKIS